MATAFNLTAQLNLRGPNNVNKIVADIKKQLSGITANVNLKLDPNVAKNVKALDSSLKSLNSTLAKTSTNAGSAASAIASFGKAVNSVSIKNIPSQINATVSSMNKLNKSSSSVSQSLTESATEMQEFGKQAGLAIRRFAAFSAVTGVIYSLSNSISQGVQAFIEYDKELVRLQQVTGQTAGGLKSLQDSISQLATGFGVSSKELTTVSVTLAQAGLSAKDTERALRALALSSLAPSFDNMNETVEGSIALMRQFGISAGQLEQALGSINAVAAAFAVEADDLITAIQRTGGVFATASKGVSEGTDALNEFISVFTSVRATTRESAETIATGLRTIFTRIQRGSTIDALKEFGVTLTDSEGKFVGAYKAVQLLSEGLSKIDTRDIKFSRIVEELGGFRQIGKVIPLIQQFSVAQNALKIAQTGQSSLAKDASTAQLSLANQIQKVREEFFALFREIGQSKGFQSLLTGVLTLTRGLIKLADVTKSLLPALSVVLAFKGASALTQFASGFSKGFRPGGGKPEKERPRFADGGRVRRFATGGVVPGSGDRDTVPAMLTPGEFVVRKQAVKSIGTAQLHRMNKRAKGGPITVEKLKDINPNAVQPDYRNTEEAKNKVGEKDQTWSTYRDQGKRGKVRSTAVKYMQPRDEVYGDVEYVPIPDPNRSEVEKYFGKIVLKKGTKSINPKDKRISTAYEDYAQDKVKTIGARYSGDYDPLDFETGDVKFYSSEENIQKYVSINKVLSKRLRHQNKDNRIKWQPNSPEQKGLEPTTIYHPTDLTENNNLKKRISDWILLSQNQRTTQAIREGGSFSFGGLVQKFAEGGKAARVRRVGIIDSDVLRDKINAEKVAQGMESIGSDSIQDYTIQLAKLGVQKRKSGDLKKFRVIAGAAGSGKSSLATGVSANDNATLRKTIRSHIITPQDLDSVDEILTITANVSDAKLAGYLRDADRTYTVSSSTKAEQDLIKRNKESRDITGQGLYGREPGRTKGVPADFGVEEATLIDELGSKNVVLGRKEDAEGNLTNRFRRKRADELPEIVQAEGFYTGGFAPPTRGHRGAFDTLLANVIAKNPKATLKDILVSVAPNVAMVEGKEGLEHAARYGIFDADFRSLLADVNFKGAMISQDAQSTPGILPKVMEVPSENNRRKFARLKGAMAITSGKEKGVLGKYERAGIEVTDIPRIEDISATKVRELLFSQNYTELDKIVNPEVGAILKGNQPQLKNRSVMVPVLLEELHKAAEANAVSANQKADDILANAPGGPYANVSKKLKTEHPDIAAQVKLIREQRDQFKKSISGAKAHSIISELSAAYPEIYGIDSSRRAATAAASISAEDARSHLGDKVQSLLPEGAGTPGSSLLESIKQNVTKQLAIPKGSGTLPTDSKTITSSFLNAKIPSDPTFGIFSGKTIDPGIVKKVWRQTYPGLSEDKTASYVALKEWLEAQYNARTGAKTEELSQAIKESKMVGLVGMLPIGHEKLSGPFTWMLGKNTAGEDVSVTASIIERGLGKQYEDEIKKAQSYAEQGSEVLASGLASKMKKPPTSLRSLSKDQLETLGQGNIEGAYLEQGLARLWANLDNVSTRTRPIDYPDGLGESAELFPGISPTMPTEVKRTINSDSRSDAIEEFQRYFRLINGVPEPKAKKEAVKALASGGEVQKFMAGGVATKTRKPKEVFGTGETEFPSRISKKYAEEQHSASESLRSKLAWDKNPKDERIMVDDQKIQETYQQPFDRDRFASSFKEKISRDSLFERMSDFAKFVGLPQEDLLKTLPLQLDFGPSKRGGGLSGYAAAQFQRDPVGVRPYDGYDLSKFGYEEKQKQEAYGLKKLIEAKEKEIAKIVKTPTETFDDGSFSFDREAYQKANGELDSFKKKSYELSKLKSEAEKAALAEQQAVSSATGRGTIGFASSMGYSSDTKNSVLYHEMTHQLFQGLRTKSADSFDKYRDRVSSLFSGDNDDLADAFDALTEKTGGYSSADVVYGRSYKSRSLDQILSNYYRNLGDSSGIATPVPADTTKDLAALNMQARTTKRAREYRPINPKINEALLKGGSKFGATQEAIDRMEDSGKEEFLTTLMENAPNLDSNLQSILDSTLTELLSGAGIQRQKFAVGGRASRKVDYEAGVGASPFGGVISKKLSQSVYSLQKGTGLSDSEFNEIKKTADTYGYNEEEFKEYLAKRIQEKKNKEGLRTDRSALLQQLMPTNRVSTPKQLALAETLRGEPDAGYRPIPTAAERIASDRMAVQNATRRFASGGTVSALVSNGEAYVPPKIAKSIGYGNLSLMNQADRNGMSKFSSGGISVFKGPGSGTSDSIPANLPVGSFILREKATKALGLNKGGPVPAQRFATGGGVTSMIMEWLSSDMTAGTKPKMAPRPDVVNRSSVVASNDTTKALDTLVKALNQLGLSAANSADILNKGGQVSYKTIQKALAEDIKRLKISGASIQSIVAAETTLANIRKKSKEEVNKQKNIQGLTSLRGNSSTKIVGGQTIGDLQAGSGAGQQAIETQAQMLAAARIKRRGGKVTEKQRSEIMESSYVDSASRITGIKKRDFKNAGISGGDIQKYIADSMKDRKSLSQMDKQLITLKTNELTNSAAYVAASNAEQKRMLTQVQQATKEEISTRRKIINDLAAQNGTKGVGAAGLRDYKNSPILNQIKGFIKSPGRVMGGASVAAGLTAGASDMIAKNMYNMSTTEGQGKAAKTSAAIQSSGTILSTGLAAASQMAAIPVIGPYVAALTAVGTAAAAAADYFYDFTGAQKAATVEFERSVRAKEIGIAMDGLDRAFQNFQKDVGNINLQNALEKSLGGASSLQIKDNMAERDNAKAEFSLKNRGWSDIFSGNFKGSAKMDALQQGAMDSEMSQKITPIADKAMSLYEQQINNGKSIQDIVNNVRTGNKEAGSAGFAVAASVNPKLWSELETKIEKSGDTSEQNREKIQKEIAARELLTNVQLQSIERMTKLNKEMEAADRAGRRLAETFEHIGETIDQSIQRMQRESQIRQAQANDRVEARRGNAGFDERAVNNRNVGVLTSPKAYQNDPGRIEEAIRAGTNGMAPELAQKMAGGARLEATLPNVMRNAISSELKTNASLELGDAVKAARTRGTEAIRNSGLSEADQKVAIDKLNTTLTKEEEKAQKDGGESQREKVDSFIDSVSELGPAIANMFGNAGKRLDDIIQAKQGIYDTFAKNLQAASEAAKKARDSFNKAIDIRYNAKMDLREAQTGVGESYSEAKAKSDSDIARLTGGVTDPQAIGRNISALMAQRDQQMKARDAAASNPNPALTKDQQKDVAAKFARDIQATNNALNNNREALDKMANSAEVAQKALDEVKNVKGLQQDRENFVNQLLTNTPEEADKLNQSFIRLQRNLSGGLNNASNQRDAQNAFNDTLRRTGNLREATRAGNTVLADQRKQTLQLMQDPGFRGMMTLNMKNQGMSDKDIDNKFRQQEGILMEQMAVESGMINNPMVQQALAAKQDPNADPAMKRAADQFLQSTGLQAKASEEQGRLELANVQSLLVTATDDLKMSIDNLTATINASVSKDGERVPGFAGPMVPMPAGARGVRPVGRMATGGQVKTQYASVGKLIDFSPKGTDTVPAMLTPGEFVVNARSTSQHLPLLKAINSGAGVDATSNMSKGGVVYLNDGGLIAEFDRIDANRSKFLESGEIDLKILELLDRDRDGKVSIAEYFSRIQGGSGDSGENINLGQMPLSGNSASQANNSSFENYSSGRAKTYSDKYESPRDEFPRQSDPPQNLASGGVVSPYYLVEGTKGPLPSRIGMKAMPPKKDPIEIARAARKTGVPTKKRPSLVPGDPRGTDTEPSFFRLDLNEDGVLDRKEGYPYQDLDKDKDGKITQQEWKSRVLARARVRELENQIKIDQEIIDNGGAVPADFEQKKLKLDWAKINAGMAAADGDNQAFIARQKRIEDNVNNRLRGGGSLNSPDGSFVFNREFGKINDRRSAFEEERRAQRAKDENATDEEIFDRTVEAYGAGDANYWRNSMGVTELPNVYDNSRTLDVIRNESDLSSRGDPNGERTKAYIDRYAQELGARSQADRVARGIGEKPDSPDIAVTGTQGPVDNLNYLIDQREKGRVAEKAARDENFKQENINRQAADARQAQLDQRDKELGINTSDINRTIYETGGGFSNQPGSGRAVSVEEQKQRRRERAIAARFSFTDKTGKHSTTGTIDKVDFDKGTVRIAKIDPKTGEPKVGEKGEQIYTTVPLDRLGDKSRDKVRSYGLEKEADKAKAGENFTIGNSFEDYKGKIFRVDEKSGKVIVQKEDGKLVSVPMGIIDPETKNVALDQAKTATTVTDLTQKQMDADISSVAPTIPELPEISTIGEEEWANKAHQKAVDQAMEDAAMEQAKIDGLSVMPELEPSTAVVDPITRQALGVKQETVAGGPSRAQFLNGNGKVAQTKQEAIDIQTQQATIDIARKNSEQRYQELRGRSKAESAYDRSWLGENWPKEWGGVSKPEKRLTRKELEELGAMESERGVPALSRLGANTRAEQTRRSAGLDEAQIESLSQQQTQKFQTQLEKDKDSEGGEAVGLAAQRAVVPLLAGATAIAAAPALVPAGIIGAGLTIAGGVGVSLGANKLQDMALEGTDFDKRQKELAEKRPGATAVGALLPGLLTGNPLTGAATVRQALATRAASGATEAALGAGIRGATNGGNFGTYEDFQNDFLSGVILPSSNFGGKGSRNYSRPEGPAKPTSLRRVAETVRDEQLAIRGENVLAGNEIIATKRKKQAEQKIRDEAEAAKEAKREEFVYNISTFGGRLSDDNIASALKSAKDTTVTGAKLLTGKATGKPRGDLIEQNPTLASRLGVSTPGLDSVKNGQNITAKDLVAKLKDEGFSEEYAKKVSRERTLQMVSDLATERSKRQDESIQQVASEYKDAVTGVEDPNKRAKIKAKFQTRLQKELSSIVSDTNDRAEAFDSGMTVQELKKQRAETAQAKDQAEADKLIQDFDSTLGSSKPTTIDNPPIGKPFDLGTDPLAPITSAKDNAATAAASRKPVDAETNTPTPIDSPPVGQPLDAVVDPVAPIKTTKDAAEAPARDKAVTTTATRDAADTLSVPNKRRIASDVADRMLGGDKAYDKQLAEEEAFLKENPALKKAKDNALQERQRTTKDEDGNEGRPVSLRGDTIRRKSEFYDAYSRYTDREDYHAKDRSGIVAGQTGGISTGYKTRFAIKKGKMNEFMDRVMADEELSQYISYMKQFGFDETEIPSGAEKRFLNFYSKQGDLESATAIDAIMSGKYRDLLVEGGALNYGREGEFLMPSGLGSSRFDAGGNAGNFFPDASVGRKEEFLKAVIDRARKSRSSDVNKDWKVARRYDMIVDDAAKQKASSLSGNFLYDVGSRFSTAEMDDLLKQFPDLFTNFSGMKPEFPVGSGSEARVSPQQQAAVDTATRDATSSPTKSDKDGLDIEGALKEFDEETKAKSAAETENKARSESQARKVETKSQDEQTSYQMELGQLSAAQLADLDAKYFDQTGIRAKDIEEEINTGVPTLLTNSKAKLAESQAREAENQSQPYDSDQYEYLPDDYDYDDKVVVAVEPEDGTSNFFATESAAEQAAREATRTPIKTNDDQFVVDQPDYMTPSELTPETRGFGRKVFGPDSDKAFEAMPKPKISREKVKELDTGEPDEMTASEITPLQRAVINKSYGPDSDQDFQLREKLIAQKREADIDAILFEDFFPNGSSRTETPLSSARTEAEARNPGAVFEGPLEGALTDASSPEVLKASTEARKKLAAQKLAAKSPEQISVEKTYGPLYREAKKANDTAEMARIKSVASAEFKKRSQEASVKAEDKKNDFLPVMGKVLAIAAPVGSAIGYGLGSLLSGAMGKKKEESLASRLENASSLQEVFDLLKLAEKDKTGNPTNPLREIGGSSPVVAKLQKLAPEIYGEKGSDYFSAQDLAAMPTDAYDKNFLDRLKNNAEFENIRREQRAAEPARLKANEATTRDLTSKWSKDFALAGSDVKTVDIPPDSDRNQLEVMSKALSETRRGRFPTDDEGNDLPIGTMIPAPMPALDRTKNDAAAMREIDATDNDAAPMPGAKKPVKKARGGLIYAAEGMKIPRPNTILSSSQSNSRPYDRYAASTSQPIDIGKSSENSFSEYIKSGGRRMSDNVIDTRNQKDANRQWYESDLLGGGWNRDPDDKNDKTPPPFGWVLANGPSRIYQKLFPTKYDPLDQYVQNIENKKQEKIAKQQAFSHEQEKRKKKELAEGIPGIEDLMRGDSSMEGSPPAGGRVQYATGGIVYANNGALINAQPMGTDTVPAMLTPGEFVVKKEQAQKHAPILHAINSGAYSRGGIVNYLANGGIVNPNYLSAGSLVERWKEKQRRGELGNKSFIVGSGKRLYHDPEEQRQYEKEEAEKEAKRLADRESGQDMIDYFTKRGRLDGAKQIAAYTPSIEAPRDPRDVTGTSYDPLTDPNKKEKADRLADQFYQEQNRKSQQPPVASMGPAPINTAPPIRSAPAPAAPLPPPPVSVPPSVPAAPAGGVSNNVGMDVAGLQSIVSNLQQTVNNFGASIPSLSEVAESMNTSFSSFITGGAQVGEMLNSATAGLQQVNIPDVITVGGTLDSRHTFNGAEAANNVLATLGPTMERQADQKIGNLAGNINRGVGNLAEGSLGPDTSQVLRS